MPLIADEQPQSTVADDGSLLAPPQRVLSTLNRDGSRRWLKPRLSPGRFLRARRIVACALIALFALVPHLRMAGEPLMLLDVASRRFVFFGLVFLPTDAVMLAIFVLSIVFSILLFTALLGRVWCGWACPQTVYLEFLYRPIERLIEGTAGRGGRARGDVSPARRLAMMVLYLAASLFLAHTFLAYFVGVDALRAWVLRSPLEHPGSFAVMLVTTALMMFNFTYFREQTCLVACPYGRLQSVLLDRDSLIISYDPERGEPRGRGRRSLPVAGHGAADTRGDCVDCGLCVITCPTGIDIRDGLQMECVACAQCIDACDEVMDRIGRPRGLIRYTSETRLTGERSRVIRTRVVLYGLLVAALAGIFGLLVASRADTQVTIARERGLPYVRMPDGRISNPLRIKIANHGRQEACYTISVPDRSDLELITPENPACVEAGATRSLGVVVVLPPAAFEAGVCRVTLRVDDGRGFVKQTRYKLFGPGHISPDGGAERGESE